MGLGLVLGGALGNLVDRLRFRAVVDFLDFHVGDWHWPAFNVADTAICLGAFLACAVIWRKTPAMGGLPIKNRQATGEMRHEFRLVASADRTDPHAPQFLEHLAHLGS